MNFNINGIKIIALDNTKYSSNTRISIPVNHLRKGANVIQIDFLNKYRNDGNGLHSFVDNVDGKQYLYTNFEPSFCHYVFPTFDQPDIRAKWTLKSIIPNDWTIVSNEIENDKLNKSHLFAQLGNIAKTFKMTDNLKNMKSPKIIGFNQTPSIATYLFAFVAGPYDHVEAPAQKGMPKMRIFARGSVIQDVKGKLADEMFMVTKAGINFYQKMFGKAFAFSKYD